ncbi:hypothetical protein GLOIN_2v1482360 [Rhizophagus clarus]|nr:hypothetical protein GLOIN_2v1482360 [Rhizophagus clarus]
MEKKNPFITPEYEVFRYSAILAANKVSNDAYETLMERLPTLEQIKNSIQVSNKSITDYQKIAKELEPLTKFIDFGQIKGQILTDIIEPLEIVPSRTIMNVYRQIVRLNNLNSNEIRGIPPTIYIWDKSTCGSGLIIEDNEKVVRAGNAHQNVRAKMILDNKGIFEWNIIIEKVCKDVWVGVCATENFNYMAWAGNQSTGWILGINGKCWNNSNVLDYCSQFRNDNVKVTVHLNMNERTYAFSVDGTKYPVISEWNNLPSKLYPIVSLHSPGLLRIQPYQFLKFSKN